MDKHKANTKPNQPLAQVLQSLLLEKPSKTKKPRGAFAVALSKALAEQQKSEESNKGRRLTKAEQRLLCNYFIGVISEANFFINTVIWHFFSRSHRRARLLKVVNQLDASNKAKVKDFWLEEPLHKSQYIVRKPLDCLGKNTLFRTLNGYKGQKGYFATYPKDCVAFNEMLKMRFLVFFDRADDFVNAIEDIVHLRHFFKTTAGPDSVQEAMTQEKMQQSLAQLCYLVLPVFISLLKGKAVFLAKGTGCEEQLQIAFDKLQQDRQQRHRQSRQKFFSTHRTRENKGRATTRQWQAFEKRWQDRKREWRSAYKVQNFMYLYQRINPEGLRDFVLRYSRRSSGEISFEEIEAVHQLLSGIDLLLWAHLPKNAKAKDAKALRNRLAHNEKIGTAKNRCLRNDFTVLLTALSPQARNNFYTQLKALLKRQNVFYDQDGRKLRYPFDGTVKRVNFKWRKSVAAQISRDLDSARTAVIKDAKTIKNAKK